MTDAIKTMNSIRRLLKHPPVTWEGCVPIVNEQTKKWAYRFLRLTGDNDKSLKRREAKEKP